MEKTINIGTRGSKLALWQAYYVADLLKEAGLKANIVEIETKGDKILDKSLAKVGSKGLFTEELEVQLLEGKIDIAVHSAKDLPSDIGEHFKIIAFTEREQANDVIVSDDKELMKKPHPILGTSSVRRTALFKKYMPNATVVNMRGNLQTRIKKMRDGQCDGLVLAFAGVHRMGYNDMIVQHLPTEQFVPPVGQGSVAIEVANTLDNEIEAAIFKAVNHSESATCLSAERAFLKKLQGGCSIPAFAHAKIENSKVHMRGGIIDTDGVGFVERKMSAIAEEASQLGTNLAQDILENGGDKILAKLKSEE